MEDNHHVVLKSRPGVNGSPEGSNFSYEPCEEVQAADLRPGEALIKTLYLSVDPAQRCQMNESTGADYLAPWDLGKTIVGLAGVGSVVASKHPEFEIGDLVHGSPAYPWKAYFTQDMTWFKKLDKRLVGEKPSLALSLLSIPGLTALLGIWEKGHVVKGANQTIVVSGAAGACGSLAGQIARLEGCKHVVGICGTDEKCSWLKTELGFVEAINYKTEDVDKRLEEVCPDGIDIYFDNVGGKISDTVISQMKQDAHIVLCGQISVYNEDVPYPPPLPENTMAILKDKHITRERFMVLNYSNRFDEALQQLATWHITGQIKVRETVMEGLDKAGEAFASMMRGGNIGKQVVHVADP